MKNFITNETIVYLFDVKKYGNRDQLGRLETSERILQ
jgi:hypothetical protein